MTLDEYEKLQEEKKTNLNKKPATAVKVDTKAFEGMKAYNRKDVPDDNELGLSEKKQLGKSKSGVSDKIRKEVRNNFSQLRLSRPVFEASETKQ